MNLGFRLAAVLAATVMLAACGGEGNGGDGNGGDGGDGGGGDVTVVAADFSFDPATIEVDAGETISVTLQNEDEADHSFTVEELDFEVEAEGGESATAELTAGEESVEFFCRFHPDQMRGEISVSGSDGAGSGGESEEQPEDDGGGLDY